MRECFSEFERAVFREISEWVLKKNEEMKAKGFEILYFKNDKELIDAFWKEKLEQ